jgi:hypothetical protein
MIEFEDSLLPAHDDVISFGDILTRDGRPAAFAVRGCAFTVHKGSAFTLTPMLDLRSSAA